MKRLLAQTWIDFWLRRSGLSRFGRLATWLGAWPTAPYKARVGLAHRYPQGYVAPSALVKGADVRLGRHVFIGDRVVVFRRGGGAPVELGDKVEIHNDTTIEVGDGGAVRIGAVTGVQARCQLSAYRAAIEIGAGAQIAPACAFYTYDHGTAPGATIRGQPLTTRGDIVIGEDAWLGYGAVVLSGVRIGAGAVIGAGSVVTRDIPAGAIAVGQPAKVVRMRDETGAADLLESLRSASWRHS
jgi:acetyltransferase-like isoleucine patch superfamily enzyme